MAQNRLHIEWLDKNDRVSLYAKYALMELAQTGEIDFVRIKPSSWDHNILSEESIRKLSPAQSFIVARQDNRQYKVILDCSESFFYISPTITDVDLYFFSSYNCDLFEKHHFFPPYAWQTNRQVSDYEEKFRQIDQKYGNHFFKIVPFIPYPMSMAIPARNFNRPKQVFIVFLLLARYIKKWLPKTSIGKFDPEFLLYRFRYELIKGYRANPLKYDVVLRDSLFAWPWHRVLLHRALKKISGKNMITSISTPDIDNPDAWWRKEIPDNELNKVIQLLEDAPHFPEDFEKMITSSRLSIFSTGKHWGWRGITFLSLLCGGPLLMDSPIFKPYFPLSEFKLFYNHDEWTQVNSVLDDIDKDEWSTIRQHNQQKFDKYLAPLAVARYICETISTRMNEAYNVNSRQRKE